MEKKDDSISKIPEDLPPRIPKEELEAQTRSVLERVDDPHGVISEDVLTRSTDLLSAIVHARHYSGFTPYSDAHVGILINEIVRTVDGHRDHFRDNGRPYYDHLFGAAQHLVLDQGITGLETVLAAFKHDDPEDIKTPFPDLIRLDLYRGQIGELPDDCRFIRRDVAKLVEGCTKIPRDERVLTESVTFARFLEVMRDTGIRVASVKLADRTHNQLDIRSHPSPSRQMDITRETERVHVSFANLLQLRESVRILVDACVQFDNESLANDFRDLSDARYNARLKLCRDEIDAHFDPKDKKNRTDRRLLKGIIHPPIYQQSSLSDFVLRGIPFHKLQLDDLNLGPLDPLFEVLILTESEPEPLPPNQIMAYILRRFGGGGRVEIYIPHNEQPPMRGAIVKIYSKEFGGILVFRINDIHSESRAKRGALAAFKEGVSPDMRVSINQILAAYDKNPKLIFPVASEILLRPTVTVYTPEDRRIELPRGATVLDFAAAVHTDLLIGLQSARVSNHIFDTRYRKIGIFDEVPPDTVIYVESCLAKKKAARDPSRIIVDPGWLLFCETERAKDTLKKHFLRGREDAEMDPEVISRGEQYTQRISKLFDIPIKTVMAVVRQNWRKLSQAKDDRIFFQIGRGSLDIIKILAQAIYAKQQEWTVSVYLPSRPGALHSFLQEFKVQGVNVDEIVRHERAPASETMETFIPDRLYLKISDQDGIKDAYGMMKILLKLSYNFPISVAPTLS